MATPEQSTDTPSNSLFAAVNRTVLIVLFTGVETVALGLWLAFVEDAAVLSQATAIGLGILLVGLLVEHVLTDAAVRGSFSVPGGGVVFFSATETALWALWLVIAEQIGGLVGVGVAGVVLAVLLVPQHTIEDNILRGRGLFSRLLDGGTVGFSIIEAAGATVWLAFVFEGELLVDEIVRLFEQVGIDLVLEVDPALVGLGILAVALLIEHLVGVRFSRRA